MAPRTLKRKRAPVSYKEPSSDEDILSDSDNARSSARRHTTRPQRRSTRRAARDQSETREYEQQSNSRNTEQDVTGRANRSTRRQKPKVSYRESSSDEFEGDSDSSVEQEKTFTLQERPKPKPKPRSSPKSQSKASRPVQSGRGLGAPLKRRHLAVPTSTTSTPTIPTDGRIPQWSSLPYHVLLEIFVYASRPLQDGSIPWLARMARMCSTFTAPALTALYRNPPIFAIKQKRKDLVHHLISPPSTVPYNYSVMPKRLELDATKMSHLTEPANSTDDLKSLILSLKTLRDIDIFDPWDRPPYRPRSKTSRRWHYPDELFEALRESELRLIRWRWNMTFARSRGGPLWMKTIHAENAFCNLKDLTLTRFETDDRSEDVENGSPPSQEELLASAIAVLPRLKTLSFESSTIANKHLLPLLPKNLISLSFTNCERLTSEDLQSFLVTHGAHMEELILDHNRSLDLSFLIDLKPSCPRLEILRMDLNYYSSLAFSNDSDPNYEEMLAEGEIPSWPATLNVIEIEYLRKWTPIAAKGFFSSLIDSAADLPYLRELKISAMVDIDWRERAAFRNEWTARFEHVFLRKATPPSPHLVSLRAFREWKAAQAPVKEKNDSFIDSDGAEHSGDDEDDMPLMSRARRGEKGKEKWNPGRLRTRARPSSSGGDSGSEHPDTPNTEHEGLVVQGMCDKVIFRLDNFRPREERFDENDFLDSEASGDEDWDGNDYVADGYAW